VFERVYIDTPMARPKNFQIDHGVTKLAEKAQVAIQTVSRKLKQGKTPEQILAEAEEWRAKMKANEDKAASGEESHFDASRRKERAIADLRELELSVKRGELVKIGEMNAWVSGMILRAREILTRIAPELRDRLAKETDPNRIQELIDAEVSRALVQLSQFRASE
jgi:hypothetical protein